MKRPAPPELGSLSAGHVRWVSEVCNGFEDHWGRVDRPTVQEYMRGATGDADPVVKLVLLRELLTSERELRERDAKARDIDAYRAFFNGSGENDVVDFVLGDEARADGARRFQVIEPHAEGGLGEVLIAHDRQLDRNVAMKRIKPELAEDESSRNRFLREAEITGQLEHPNIAPVYSLGLDRDRLPFYTMRFIEGQPLQEAISHFHKSDASRSDQGRRLLALRKLLGRYNAVCDAVAFANSRGVLHRDIKPANVILGRFGETILADWGLANRNAAVEDDSRDGPVSQSGHEGMRMTEHGSVMGTLPYMSPEQAQSATGPLSLASDIYSLGATLYHLLTGRPPFGGKDHEELRRKVMKGDFPAPRRVDPAVPRALEAIVVKAMAHEPGDRYTTATALAEDIEHWLADEPVTAWREPVSIRTRRKLRRHRTLVISTAAALFVGVIGLASFAMVLAGMNRELDGQRNQAVDQRNRAETARDLAFSAVTAIIATDTDEMLSEELRPYRAMLLDEGLRLSREMIQGAEGDTRAAKLRAQALMMAAKILFEKGEHARADEVARQSIDLVDKLVAPDPADIGNRDSLAHLLCLQAAMTTSPETGRSNAWRSNEIYKSLLRETPRAPRAARWIAETATNLHNVGDRYFVESGSASGEKRLDALQKAIDAFSEGRRFCAEQAGQMSEPDRMLLALAVNERYLCRAYRAKTSLLVDQHQRSEAFEKTIACGKEAIADFQTLTDHGPSHYRHSLELHEAQRELGLAFFDRERWHEAARAYKQARETLKLMAQRHGELVSRMVWIQENIAFEDYNMMNVLTLDDGANQKLMRDLVDEAYAICDKLDVVRPLSPKLRQVYAYASFNKADAIAETTGIPDVDLNRKAARLYEGLIGENPADLVSRCYVVVARLELADALAARGQNDESRTTENAALAVAKGHPDVFFQTGYNYAAGAQAIAKGPSKLDSAAREKLRQRYARRVIPMLREAVAAGFKDSARLRKDPAFASFHADPEFQAILRDLLFLTQPFAAP